MGQPIVQIRGHQDAHAVIVPYSVTSGLRDRVTRFDAILGLRLALGCPTRTPGWTRSHVRYIP